eukprot:2379072-Rhodomonas_salina.1
MAVPIGRGTDLAKLAGTESGGPEAAKGGAGAGAGPRLRHDRNRAPHPGPVPEMYFFCVPLVVPRMSCSGPKRDFPE